LILPQTFSTGGTSNEKSWICGLLRESDVRYVVNVWYTGSLVAWSCSGIGWFINQMVCVIPEYRIRSIRRHTSRCAGGNSQRSQILAATNI